VRISPPPPPPPPPPRCAGRRSWWWLPGAGPVPASATAGRCSCSSCSVASSPSSPAAVCIPAQSIKSSFLLSLLPSRSRAG
jgi:hypothetical protein